MKSKINIQANLFDNKSKLSDLENKNLINEHFAKNIIRTICGKNKIIHYNQDNSIFSIKLKKDDKVYKEIFYINNLEIEFNYEAT